FLLSNPDRGAGTHPLGRTLTASCGSRTISRGRTERCPRGGDVMRLQATERWMLDLRGSRPWTEDEGHRVIAAWSTSGETVAAFARRVGLSAGRIYWWRARTGGVQTTGGV